MSDNNPMTKGRKRQYHHSTRSGKAKYQPKRGGPGIILTCDTGRDGKARREGLEILNYYYKANKGEDSEKKKEEPPVSLEDELAQLKKETGPKEHYKDRGPFMEYETGCRGTVFVLCNLPDCNLVPIKHVKKDNPENGDKPNENGGEEPDTKKAKTEEEAKPPAADDTSSTTPQWDPTDAVRRVMNDLHQESVDVNYRNAKIPGSRFVARMIPMQATCFANIQEITITFRALLDHWVLPKMDTTQQKSYAIKFKKRNCGLVTSKQVIDAIVGEIDQVTSQFPNKEWKVNLNEPDYRIQVEICKTLCGISILAASQEDQLMVKHNFNLADLRTLAAAARRTDIAKKEEEEAKEEDPEEGKKEEDEK